MKIEQVWQAVSEGKTVYWHNKAYKVYVSDANPLLGFQLNHFSFKDGKILSVRHIENYFGGLIEDSDLEHCFTEGDEK